MRIIILIIFFNFTPAMAFADDLETFDMTLPNKKTCAVGLINMRGVCINPVAVSVRDFTAATINDSGLNQTSIDFLERLRK